MCYFCTQLFALAFKLDELCPRFWLHCQLKPCRSAGSNNSLRFTSWSCFSWNLSHSFFTLEKNTVCGIQQYLCLVALRATVLSPTCLTQMMDTHPPWARRKGSKHFEVNLEMKKEQSNWWKHDAPAKNDAWIVSITNHNHSHNDDYSHAKFAPNHVFFCVSRRHMLYACTVALGVCRRLHWTQRSSQRYLGKITRINWHVTWHCSTEKNKLRICFPFVFTVYLYT